MANSITPATLYEYLKEKDDVFLLDIRPPDDFSAWHIEGSVSIPFPQLSSQIRKLPKNRDIITICNRGKDAGQAVKLLQNAGRTAKVLQDGLKGWNNVYDLVEIPFTKGVHVSTIQIKRLGKGCLSSILIFPDKTAMIIDPSRHKHVYIDIVTKHNLIPIVVIDTHIHADHVSGGRILAKHWNIPYALPEKSDVHFPFTAIPSLSRTLPLQVFSTPGHTMESVAIVVDDTVVFTGDTLFLDTVGRTDLTDEYNDGARHLYRSIKEIIFSLPDNLFVMPSHAADGLTAGLVRGAHMRYLKKFNEISNIISPDEFVELQNKNTQPVPNNYRKIKKMNRHGTIPKNEDLDELEMGSNSCAVSTTLLS